MKFRDLRSTSCVILFFAGCTWRSAETPVEKKLDPVVTAQQKAPNKNDLKGKALFSKELKESLHFVASLERESLRLISKNNSFEGATLFSTLSYAFEIASGTKRSAPPNIDCSRFQIEAEGGGPNLLKVYKICQRPRTLLATIQSSSNETRLKVIFKIKDWASVVGLSVTLTNPDTECDLETKDKKLSALSCENWAYLISSNDVSATEIHLKTFSFNRDEQLQLKLRGGFYRDLIERKKLTWWFPCREN